MLWHTIAHDYDEYYEGAQYYPFEGPGTDLDTQVKLVLSLFDNNEPFHMSVGYLGGKPIEVVLKTDKIEYTIVPIVQRQE